MSVNYSFTNGQSDAGSLYAAARVQALENLKNLFEVYFINTNAVIGDANVPHSP